MGGKKPVVVETERKKYPIRPEDYELYEDIGQGVTACVYRARCIPLNEIVAVKVLDLEKHNSDLNNISREAQTMILLDHPNLLKAHCSFAHNETLWVVMPYMSGGSCLHILKAAYSEGFGEGVIATVLREVLRGLEYLHNHGHIHRDVKAGNILVDGRGGIKLGDFGVSASLFDSGDRKRVRNTFVGTPCWMAPEVLEQLHGYDFKADIWSFGITALELAHGHAPFSKYPPMKVLLMTLQNAPPSLSDDKDKKFSKSFKQMIAMCLAKVPSKRPTAHKLLKHSFFKQARSQDYIARKILEGLPPLGDRIKALKLKEEDMLAQRKMPDGKKEEISQSEYKRGISAWNFDIEDLKMQASLIQDEDCYSEKDIAGCSNSLFELGSSQVMRSPSISSASCSSREDIEMENFETMQRISAITPFPDQMPPSQRGKSIRPDNGFIASCSYDQNAVSNGLHFHENEMENHLSGNGASKIANGHLSTMDPQSSHEKKGSTCCSASGVAQTSFKAESGTLQHHAQNVGVCNGTVSQMGNGLPPEAILKASKSTASVVEDIDTKSKAPVVQQKGRFKVTSENVELEKAPPSPSIPKCHSVQAISQLPAANLPSPPSAKRSPPGSALFPQLQSILQTNILQRDNILNLMRQVSTGDLLANRTSDGTSTETPANMTEKSLLEAAHEREKELLQEVTDLQLRLLCAHEELQRLKTRNAQA